MAARAQAERALPGANAMRVLTSAAAATLLATICADIPMGRRLLKVPGRRLGWVEKGFPMMF
jgi:hypothetical protein